MKDFFESVPKKTSNAADRQSVRTTFKLSERTIEILEKLKTNWGLPTMDILDDAGEFLLDAFLQLGKRNKRQGSLPPEALNMLGISVKPITDEGRRKAYVVSRGFLRRVNEASVMFNLNRDMLVEGLITRSYESEENHRKETREKYNQALEVLKRVNTAAEIAETELIGLFKDDSIGIFSPITERFNEVRSTLLYLLTAIHDYTETGKLIDPDFLDQSHDLITNW